MLRADPRDPGGRRAAGAPVLDRPPAWPAIVLRTPKGWTGPDVVDGVQIQGTFRAHQVPLSHVREDPEHLALLETWLRSYAPERHFDERGRLVPELAALAPEGDKRMGSSPYANGGRLMRPLDLPSIDDYAIGVEAPGAELAESTRRLGAMLRDIYRRNPTSFRLFCPDETASNRLQDVFDASNRCLVAPILATDDHLSADGRVMEVLSEHLCEGWLEGYLLSGRHGLFATYEAFAMVSASMTVQHAKWLQEARDLDWRAPVASLNVLLTSTCWRNDHNGFSHQGPGLIDAMISLSGAIVRVYLPPDANCLLSVAEHAFESRDYVNLIVVGQAAAAAVPRHGRRARALRARGRRVGVGGHGRRWRARRRHGLRRRRRHDGGARSRRAAAPLHARPRGPLRQRGRPHVARAARDPSPRLVPRSAFERLFGRGAPR